ncbi:MAG: hypothetical protein ACREFX_07830, partial [Opitutaceae bacterium]
MTKRWIFGAALCMAGAFGTGAPAAAQPITSSGQAYSVVNAFPNLTFEDPTCVTPLPGTNRIYV